MNVLTTMAPGLIGQRRPACAETRAVDTVPLQPAAIDRHALAQAIGLSNDEQVPVSRTVGRPAAAALA
ncbi:hypothetical protein O4H66_19820 [Comamonadaceae bacterium G21597-S1]|nr:hypothetical protein [Comamonadaceae bacterium G21597-S1]